MRLALALTFAIGAAVLASGQQAPATMELRGRVVDALSGAPIPGVAIQGYLHNSMGSESRQARTDAGGAFTLPEIVAGEYPISAARPGYLPSEHGRKRPGGSGIPVTVATGSTPAPITILMWRSGSIAGRVFDERGRPAVQVSVSALAVEDSGGERRVSYGPSSTTNDLGEYFISNLGPGRYIVAVPVRLETRRVNPKVGRWDGAPTGSSAILLDEDGTAALTSGFLSDGLLPPAPVNGKRFAYVSSFHGGTRADEARVVEINSGTDVEGVDVDLQLRTVVRVSGTIAGPAGPVPGATIVLRPLDWGGNAPSTGRLVAYATDDGRFTFLAVPQGHYELRATRKLPTPGMVSLTANGSTGLPMDDVIMTDDQDFRDDTSLVVGGEDVTDLAIAMNAGTTISGRILFADTGVVNDRQFSSFSVSLVELAPREIGSGRYAQPERPDADGVMRFTMRAQPGQYTLGIGRGASGWWIESAQVDGGESGIGPFTIGTRPMKMDVTFTRHPTRVSGTIVDAEGRPVTGANVVVFPVEDALWREMESGRTLLDQGDVQSRRIAASNFEFLGLRPADYFIAAIDEADMDGWPSGAFLERVRAVATRMHLSPGEQLVQPLVVRGLRR